MEPRGAAFSFLLFSLVCVDLESLRSDVVILECITTETHYEASGISAEGCALEPSSEIAVRWTGAKPEEQEGKNIIVFQQDCSGISPVIRLDK